MDPRKMPPIDIEAEARALFGHSLDAWTAAERQLAAAYDVQDAAAIRDWKSVFGQYARLLSRDDRKAGTDHFQRQMRAIQYAGGVQPRPVQGPA